MKRGRPRKYCIECHRSAFYPLDTEGYCRSCRRKGLNQKWVAIYKNKPKKELRNAMYASTIPKGIQPKDMSPEDMYKKEWKSSKLSKILKKYDDNPIVPETVKDMKLPKSIKKMHCATKEMTVYERLDLLEKMLRCIPKLRKEVADLRKQVYGK